MLAIEHRLHLFVIQGVEDFLDVAAETQPETSIARLLPLQPGRLRRIRPANSLYRVMETAPAAVEIDAGGATSLPRMISERSLPSTIVPSQARR